MDMGDNLTRKKTKPAKLPEEVLRLEILTRLPIKSVVRFKFASKSWLSLLSDPQFAKEHLTRNSTRNLNDYDRLVAQKSNKIVILSRYKETLALKTDNIHLVGSVRGLVCLRHGMKLSLWNPSVHQSKEFSVPPRHRHHSFYPIGFGFDLVSDVYKVVVLSRGTSTSASVYYSNTSSWIEIFVPNNIHLFGNLLNSSTTIVKDCPCWTFRRTIVKQQLREVLTAVKFDVGSNEFKLLPEFHYDIEEPGTFHALSYEFVDMNDRLTLIVCDRSSSKSMFDLYSLDGREGCCVWSKMYKVGPFDYGKFLVLLQGFYDGEMLFHDCGMFSCYNHKTNTINRLGTTSPPVYKVCSFRYTPSLVLLQGMKYVYLTSQTRRTSGRCFLQRLINSLRN